MTNKELLQKYVDSMVEVGSRLTIMDDRIDKTADKLDQVDDKVDALLAKIDHVDETLTDVQDNKKTKLAFLSWLGKSPAVQLILMAVALGIIQMFGLSWAADKYLHIDTNPVEESVNEPIE